jgi:hypothetical protein
MHKKFSKKSEVKRQLGRPKRRWEDNVKMHPKETGCKVTDWNTAMNLRFPQKLGSYLIC